MKKKKEKNSAKSEPDSIKSDLLGNLVLSTAGRDSGKNFLIVSVKDSEYVMLSDGNYHKLNKPKLKKLRHIKLCGLKNEIIAQKLLQGAKVFDSEIYSSIKKLTESDSTEENKQNI